MYCFTSGVNYIKDFYGIDFLETRTYYIVNDGRNYDYKGDLRGYFLVVIVVFKDLYVNDHMIVRRLYTNIMGTFKYKGVKGVTSSGVYYGDVTLVNCGTGFGVTTTLLGTIIFVPFGGIGLYTNYKR